MQVKLRMAYSKIRRITCDHLTGRLMELFWFCLQSYHYPDTLRPDRGCDKAVPCCPPASLVERIVLVSRPPVSLRVSGQW